MTIIWLTWLLLSSTDFIIISKSLLFTYSAVFLTPHLLLIPRKNPARAFSMHSVIFYSIYLLLTFDFYSTPNDKKNNNNNTEHRITEYIINTYSAMCFFAVVIPAKISLTICALLFAYFHTEKYTTYKLHIKLI